MKRWLPLLFGILLLAYLATGVYEIRPGEQAVVRRLGRVDGRPRGPGLLIGLPWGMDQVDRVAVDEQRVLEVGYQEDPPSTADSAIPGQVLTGDNHLIDVRARILFRVNGADPQAVIDYVLNRDRVTSIIGREAEVMLSSALAARADPVLFGGDRALESDLRERLTELLRDFRLGVMIDRVTIAYAKVPTELADVFHDVSRAKTEKESAERAAENARQTMLSQARQEGSRIRAEAVRAFHARLDWSRSEARNFRSLWLDNANARRDPQAAFQTLYLQEMPRVFARFRVRTLSEPGVDHLIVVPLPKE